MEKYVKLILPAPQIYITCTTDENAKNLDYIRTSNVTLEHHVQIAQLYIVHKMKKKICSWVKVSEIKVNSLNFEWPIGLLSDKILVTIGVARVFDWGGPNHKSHAMTSSEIFEKVIFCGAKIS